jgi:hypothetical protein
LRGTSTAAVAVLLYGCGGAPADTALSARSARGVKATLLAFTRALDPQNVPATCQAMRPLVTKEFMRLMDGAGGCEAVLGRLSGPSLFPTADQLASARVTVKGSAATYAVSSGPEGPMKGAMVYGNDHRWHIEPTDEAGNPVGGTASP